MWKLWSVFFLFLVYPNWNANSQNTEIAVDQCAGGQESCRVCLLLSPLCSWCADNRTSSSSRCRVAGSRLDKCVPGFTQNPQGSVNFTLDEEFTTIDGYDEGNPNTQEVIQLRPQAVNVKLRQNKAELVNITFKRVFDYPLDLYYVMDLSYSMRDDLETLKSLGSNLAESIQNVTNNVRLGFGTFVDKVMMPYASTVPDQLRDPCLNIDNATCDPVFGFRHQLSITPNGEAFRDAVESTEISGNIDSPEGGFDALMQIAVCTDEIKWRGNALRVVVFTTDASSHIAMDGKLAAILEINDMKCHLKRNFHPYLPEAMVYSKSKLMDYPSIGQLHKVFKDNKIQPIFAVTEEVFPLYKDLRNILENTFVETLNNDSSNVVDVIKNSYNTLKEQIQLSVPPPSSIPPNIDLSYRVLCPGRDWVENSLFCDNVRIGAEAVFQFEIKSTACPPNSSHIDMINIGSGSIVDSTAISLEYVSCNCDCEIDAEENSPSCSNEGTLTCGKCECYPGASGEECQCTASTTGKALEQNCTMDIYEPGVDLCNQQGTCECGKCRCDETFYGEYCECRTTGCPEECGGPDQGTCENCYGNQKCICNTNLGYYLNKDTRSCTCNDNECRRVNTTDPVCSGRGICNCDRCQCDPKFDGTFCQTCVHPDCTGLLGNCNGEELRDCAECVYEQDRAERVATAQCESVCQDMNILFSVRDELLDCDNCIEDCATCSTLSKDPDIHVPQECSGISQENGCDYTYKIFWDTRLNQFAIQVRKFNSERDCPGPINPLLIVLPVVAGIVLLGLIALILWKIFQTIRDKNEYKQFLEETKQSDWSQGVNPLFTKPTDRIENPAYIGGS